VTRRNVASVVLTAGSLFLLVPGLLQPMLTITASITVMGVTRELFHQTQSALQAARSLHESGNDFVAGLILLFSVTIPFLKAIVFFVIISLKPSSLRYRLYLLVRSISKWSMADVFAVGVLIAFLAGRATSNLDAVPERGFYYFVSYCLVSNFAFQLLRIEPPVSTALPS
jgi:paraquat-inducible protein A